MPVTLRETGYSRSDFLLSLQAKSRLEMAKDDPEALSHELWQRREPRPAAPYLKRAIDAKDHAFDRERDVKIPASWLKSHGRVELMSAAPCHSPVSSYRMFQVSLGGSLNHG